MCLKGLHKAPQVSPRSRLTCFRHWLVAFDYEEEVIVCEALNTNGVLEGQWHSQNREEFHKQFPKKKYLGQFHISKDAVKGIVQKMIDCGRYNLFSNNCQKWLKEVLKSLEVDTSNLGPDATTGAWGIAGALFVGTAVVGGVAAVAYGVKKHRAQKNANEQ